jgi:hypothetical protein
MIACLFSCEHATCAVPEAFRELFRGSEDLVTSTKGWDPGALNLAQGFSMKFRTPLVHGDVTRLLIDLNEDGDDRWSKISKTLPDVTRGKLVDRHERPYRTALRARISEDLLRNDAVIHIMIHTEEGDQRGLLLETPRDVEIADSFASKWQAKLVADGIETRVARGDLNGGLADDLTRSYQNKPYGLMRLKVPQTYFLEGKPLRWETLKKALLSSLTQIVSTFEVPKVAE